MPGYIRFSSPVHPRIDNLFDLGGCCPEAPFDRPRKYRCDVIDTGKGFLPEVWKHPLLKVGEATDQTGDIENSNHEYAIIRKHPDRFAKELPRIFQVLYDSTARTMLKVPSAKVTDG
jgi:hypothetical protein